MEENGTVLGLTVQYKCFEPEIVAFCCHYCAYAAADLAGVMRLQYPPNIKIILLPCSGRLDVVEVLRTFEQGADGVLVAGCLEGDCHFQEGNLYARRRVEHIKELLDQIGLDGRRIQMLNMSSAMGAHFAMAAAEITAEVQFLGPNPLRGRDVAASDEQTEVTPVPAGA